MSVPANISGYGIIGPTGNRLSSSVPVELGIRPELPRPGERTVPEADSRPREGVRVQLSTQGQMMVNGETSPAAAPSEATQTRMAVQRAQALYAANAISAQRQDDAIARS